MKLKNKIIVFIINICILASICRVDVMAASGRMSLSGGSGNVGSTVSVTSSVTCTSGPIGSAVITVSYSSGLEFVSATGGAYRSGNSVVFTDAGDGSRNNLSFSITFRIKEAGTHSIKGSATGIYDFNEEAVPNLSASATITGKAPTPPPTPKPEPKPDPKPDPKPETKPDTKPETKPDTKPDKDENKSSNNKLKSLRVNPGTLEPAFSPNQKNYTVKVPEDTKNVQISAKAEDNKAKVTVSGGKNLQPGKNTAKVIVKAEDGSVNNYHITIQCGEEVEPVVEEETTIDIGGKQYLIDETFTDDKIPAGFTKGTMNYKDTEYVVLKSLKGNLTLVSLKDSEGSTEFYIYDQEKEEFYPYLEIKISDTRSIIVLQMEKEDTMPDYMEDAVLNLSGKEFKAWKYNDFYIIKTINNDGETGFYRYDQTEKTFQRYNPDEYAVSAKQDNMTENKEMSLMSIQAEYLNYIVVGAVAFVIFLLLIILWCVLRGTKYKKRMIGYYNQITELENQHIDEFFDEEEENVQEDYDDDRFEDYDFDEHDDSDN